VKIDSNISAEPLAYVPDALVHHMFTCDSNNIGIKPRICEVHMQLIRWRFHILV